MVYLQEEGRIIRKVTPNMPDYDIPKDITFPTGYRQEFRAPEEEDGSDAKLVMRYPGIKHEVDGMPAVYSALDEEGLPLYKGPDQMYAASQRRKFGDIRDTKGFQVGQALRNSLARGEGMGFIDEINKVIPKPITAALLLGGGGALAAWLGNKLGYTSITPGAAAIGAGGLAAAGTMLWDNYQQQREREQAIQQQAQEMYQQAEKSGSILKQASLYHDPRNFILEKLQRDTQLSMSDKAMLAGKIRNMSMPEASSLEKTVRSAIGVGVGALIAKYFGLGAMCSLMGGVLGGLAFNSMQFGSNLFSSTRTPNLVNAFQNGGAGFKTYNDFYRSING